MERQQTDEVPLERYMIRIIFLFLKKVQVLRVQYLWTLQLKQKMFFFPLQTPTKSFHNHDKSHTYTDLSEELETMESNSSIDPDYDPVNITTSSQEDATDIISEKKFVVFESMIDELFNLIRCPTCNLP